MRDPAKVARAAAADGVARETVRLTMRRPQPPLLSLTTELVELVFRNNQGPHHRHPNHQARIQCGA